MFTPDLYVTFFLVEPPEIDWDQGLEVLLDLDALTLTFILGTRNLRLQLMDAKSSGFFPFVIFKTQQRVAVQMEYVLGDEGWLKYGPT